MPTDRSPEFVDRSHAATTAHDREQAAADVDALAAAEALLRSIIAEGSDAAQVAEATGLLRRIATDQQLGYDETTLHSDKWLRAAFEASARPFRANSDRWWHGVNAVGLQQRADRLGVDIPGALDTDRIARDIAESIDMEDRSTDPSDLATAAEAHLALANHNEALAYTIEYVHRSDADACSIASMLRRLIAVWDLTEDDRPGHHIIPFLHAELLQREGGRVDLAPASGTLPTICASFWTTSCTRPSLARESFDNVRLFEVGLRRTESVAFLHDDSGRRCGSGVVVDPGAFDLDPSIELADGECLVLTPGHVVGAPDDAQISFDRNPAVASYRIDALVERSPVDDLEFVLARTEPPLVGRQPVPIAAETRHAPGSPDLRNRSPVARADGDLAARFRVARR